MNCCGLTAKTPAPESFGTLFPAMTVLAFSVLSFCGTVEMYKKFESARRFAVRAVVIQTVIVLATLGIAGFLAYALIT